jgi:hypothetical protein
MNFAVCFLAIYALLQLEYVLCVRKSERLCCGAHSAKTSGRFAGGCSLVSEKRCTWLTSTSAMSEEVTWIGAADLEQQSSATTTPADVCRNHKRAEILKMFIKKKTCQTFVLDETPEPMIGIVLPSKGWTFPRWKRLRRNHNNEDIACDAVEDATVCEPTESPIMIRRTSQVVDDDSKTLLPHECFDNKHPPTLQRGMPVILQVQMIGA